MTLYIDDEVDMLALSGGRELDYNPWHFVNVRMPEEANINLARYWIWHNLSGRYCINTRQEDNWVTVYIVGFEDPTEASAFTLAMPLMTDDVYLL